MNNFTSDRVHWKMSWRRQGALWRICKVNYVWYGFGLDSCLLLCIKSIYSIAYQSDMDVIVESRVWKSKII